MERTEFINKRAVGFSLVGSVLEKTYNDILSEKSSFDKFQKENHVLYLFIVQKYIPLVFITKFLLIL